MDKKFKAMMSKLQRNKPSYYSINVDWSRHHDGEDSVVVKLYRHGDGFYEAFTSLAGLESFINALPERNEIIFRNYRDMWK